MTADEAQELVESVFDFDHVGSEMVAARKNLSSAEAQDALAEALVRAAAEDLEEPCEEDLAIVTAAAKARVAQFVKGAKFSQSGCSGL